jgi:hypothetical protein
VERGHDLKVTGKIDTEHDCAHNLALSRRDSGRIDEALEFFLHGHDLDKIIAGRVPRLKR